MNVPKFTPGVSRTFPSVIVPGAATGIEPSFRLRPPRNPFRWGRQQNCAILCQAANAACIASCSAGTSLVGTPACVALCNAGAFGCLQRC